MSGTGMYLRCAAYRLPAFLRSSLLTPPPTRPFSHSPAPADKNFIQTCLHQNKNWAQTVAHELPDLFPALAGGQHPQILWLGCADSRVPETTLLGLRPGDVFVHRNIANILPPTDLSSQAVIAYAVHHLKVSHVVVCGHTSCGGVNAALANGRLGLLDAWLMPLRQLRAENVAGWEKEGLGEKERALRLVEANVRQGVRTLRENAEVIDAVRERGLVVHGLIYDVGTGVLKQLDVKEGAQEEKKRVEAFGCK